MPTRKSLEHQLAALKQVLTIALAKESNKKKTLIGHNQLKIF